jgi:hypothetical protein
MSEDPILTELRLAAVNAKVAADAAKSVAPLPKTIIGLSDRVAALERVVHNANLGSIGSNLRSATTEANQTAINLQEIFSRSTSVTRPWAFLAVLAAVFFILIGVAAWAGISPLLQSWNWIAVPGISKDQAELLRWAESDTGQWARRFANENNYIHIEGCPSFATGFDQQTGRKTCVVWFVQ